MALIKKLPLEFEFDFLGKRFIFLALSGVLLAGSLGFVLLQGLNFGVDFRGGTLFEIKTYEAADIAQLRSDLGNLDLGEITIQEFGAPDDLIINMQKQDGGPEAERAAIDKVRALLDPIVEEYRRIEFVGPKVGEELRQAGILATLLALGAISVYIWFRFEWHFAAGALLALTHDIFTTIGFFAITQIEFNLATLAAVLTIAGYSINDTVVVFDRVREELRRYKKLEMHRVLNRAISRTLSRTVLTSVTTLLALVSLYAFGGEVIRGFTAGLIWGVIIGTYSSIAIAVPLLLVLGFRRDQMIDDDEDQDQENQAAQEPA